MGKVGTRLKSKYRKRKKSSRSIFAWAKLVQAGQPLLLVLGLGDPELLFVLHDIGQHSSANEHHIFSPGRVFNPDLELGESLRVALEDSLQIELLDLPLQPGRKARVHGRPTGQHNVFVKFRPHVDVSCLDCREHQLGHTLSFLPGWRGRSSSSIWRESSRV